LKSSLILRFCCQAAGCPHAQSGTHEGYVTQWDGTQWNQFDGKEFKKLE
jgi:hypothetical protein